MTITTRLTAKGQTTIPKPIRDLLGVRPHDLVRFEVDDGRVTVNAVRETILDFKGMLRGEEQVTDFTRLRNEVKRRVAADVAGR